MSISKQKGVGRPQYHNSTEATGGLNEVGSQLVRDVAQEGGVDSSVVVNAAEMAGFSMADLNNPQAGWTIKGILITLVFISVAMGGVALFNSGAKKKNEENVANAGKALVHVPANAFTTGSSFVGGMAEAFTTQTAGGSNVETVADKVWEVAGDYGAGLHADALANNQGIASDDAASNPGIIQRIERIPKPTVQKSSVDSANSCPERYKVKRGNTWTSILKSTNDTRAQLNECNPWMNNSGRYRADPKNFVSEDWTLAHPKN